MRVAAQLSAMERLSEQNGAAAPKISAQMLQALLNANAAADNTPAGGTSSAAAEAALLPSLLAALSATQKISEQISAQAPAQSALPTNAPPVPSLPALRMANAATSAAGTRSSSSDVVAQMLLQMQARQSQTALLQAMQLQQLQTQQAQQMRAHQAQQAQQALDLQAQQLRAHQRALQQQRALFQQTATLAANTTAQENIARSTVSVPAGHGAMWWPHLNPGLNGAASFPGSGVEMAHKAQSKSPEQQGMTIDGEWLSREQLLRIYALRSKQTCGPGEMDQAAAGRSMVVAGIFQLPPTVVRDIWSRKLGAEWTSVGWTERERHLHACEKSKTPPCSTSEEDDSYLPCSKRRRTGNSGSQSATDSQSSGTDGRQPPVD